MKVYFAHTMPDYNTVREVQALALLAGHFPDAEIINPSDLVHVNAASVLKAAGYNVMDYFTKLVRESDVLAFMLTDHNEIGPGVAKEIVEARCFNKPVYLVGKHCVDLWTVSLGGYSMLTIETMRQRIADKDRPNVPRYEDQPSSYGKPVWSDPKLIPLDPVILARAWERGEEPKLSTTYPPVTDPLPKE